SLPASDPELAAARKLAHREGPIASLLEQMDPPGYWSEPGPGYGPKYRSTVWSVILLAQLGARIEEDERLQTACDYLVSQALCAGGQFSATGAPSGTIDCLQGNLCWALTELGCDDPRLAGAFEWMARTVTGESIAPRENQKAPVRYYAGKCGPGFACGANSEQPCAWGAVKVMLALAKLPPERQTPLIKDAVQAGVDFLFSVDPATALYPSGITNHPNSSWWKFGFPVFYVTDILQVGEALAAFGLAGDPRLKNALDLIASKQTPDGRWALEYDYSGKTWLEFGKKKEPSPWVTLRALRVLKAAGY
ncbi:MAG TPA: nitrogen fixation protein NifH, partial [Candidatus Methylomirabilis sp.]|nr:nitrogen fixation protein NifH [Candidatus Methylomirabilis sp.]